MKAMILAAGLGTRLRPHTNYYPKALIPVNDIPLLEIMIRRLKHFGVTDIIVNVHHFGEQIISFLEKNNHFDINIKVSDERDQLLNTGGGVKKAGWFFEDGAPFLLCNTDILTNLDLNKFYQAHLASDALVTLAVRKRETSRYLIFSEDKKMQGWVNIKTGKMILRRSHPGNCELMAFSGLHIIDPKIFKMMPKEDSFSIIDVYLDLAANNNLRAYDDDASVWLDVGKPENLIKASTLLNDILEEQKS